MRSALVTLILLVASPEAAALSREAQEFIEISRALEPLHCEKRKLRREIALAHAEHRDSTALKKRFAELDRDPKTAKLEKRLGELEPRIRASRDPEDLAEISRHYREALYRCE